MHCICVFVSPDKLQMFDGFSCVVDCPLLGLCFNKTTLNSLYSQKIEQ